MGLYWLQFPSRLLLLYTTAGLFVRMPEIPSPNRSIQCITRTASSKPEAGWSRFLGPVFYRGIPALLVVVIFNRRQGFFCIRFRGLPARPFWLRCSGKVRLVPGLYVSSSRPGSAVL